MPFEGIKNETFENYYKANQYYPNRRRTSRNGIRRDREKSKYVPFGQQDEILWDFYSNELRANVLFPITYVDSISENRQDKVRLEFPEYKLFELEDGENYLAQKIKFFGDDFSSFITYCAFTNQFVNCSLVHVSGKPVQWIKEGKIAYILNEFYKNYFNEDWLWSLKSSVSDKYLYLDIKNELFENHKVLLHSNTGEMRQVLSLDKGLEPFLLALTQKKLYPRNGAFINTHEPRGYVKEIPLSRGDYFRFCIAHANNIVQSDVEDSNRLQIALAYSRFYYFINKVQNSIEDLTIKGQQIQFIRNNPNADFVSGEDLELFNSMIKTLIEKDYFVLNEIFDFKKSFTRIENQDVTKQINAFYNIIKNDFFDLKDRKLSSGENVKEIISFYEIPESNMVMDLITPAENLIPEEKTPTYKVVDGILQKNT